MDLYETKRLQGVLDDIIDMSDEDVTDPFADNSEDEYVASENESESSNDNVPLRKIRKIQKPSTTVTNASNSIDDSIEATIADYDADDVPSSEKDAAVAGAEDLIWNDVTGRHLKHFPYSVVNSGVTAEAIDELCEKSPYDFFKYFITNDIFKYMVVETNRYALQKIKKESPHEKSRLKALKEVDALEMEQFVGMILWMGLCKMPKIADYWSKNILYGNQVKNVMS